MLYRFATVAVLVVAVSAIAVASCDDRPITAIDDEPEDPVSEITVPIVSNAVFGSAATDASNGIVYVSMPPGSTAGTSVTVSNVQTAAVRTAILVDGGFDPIVIPAQPGHTLMVMVMAKDQIIARTEVPVVSRRPPRVVRTDPAKMKRDVPLNKVVVTVFSEPIDGGSVSNGTIRVLRGNLPVEGQLTLSSDGLTVSFAPDVDLAPDTDYSIEITTNIRDFDGDGVAQAVIATFRTVADTLHSDTVPVPPADGTAQIVISPYPLRAALGDCGVTFLRAVHADADGVTTLPFTTWRTNNSDAVYFYLSSPPYWDSIAHGSVVQATMGCGWTGRSTLTVTAGDLTRTVDVAITAGPFSAVSFGMNYYTCLLDVAGTAYCRGRNGAGELGIGFTEDTQCQGCTAFSNTFIGVTGDHKFTTISSGWSHTCGVDENGVALCWGVNDYGQLGDGSDRPFRSEPTPVATSLRFTDIGAGYHHTCGRITTGEVYCWGAYGAGIVDSITVDPVAFLGPTPVRVQTPVMFESLTVGSIHACGLDAAGAAWCWGMNHGLLGDSSTIQSFAPVPVRTTERFIRLVTENGTTCGITAAGDLYCWAGGKYDLDAERLRVPVRIALPVALTDVAPGDMLSCGLTASGEAYCWGWTWPCSSCDAVSIPPQQASQSRFVSIHSGNTHEACGITTAGSVECWRAMDFVTAGATGLAPTGDYLDNALARRVPSPLPYPLMATASAKLQQCKTRAPGHSRCS